MDLAIIDRSEVSSLRLESMISELRNVQSITRIFDPSVTLRRLKCCRPEIILYDMGFSDHSQEQLSAIRELLPHSTIIAMTSFNVQQCRSVCNELGITYCIEKSVEFERIPQIISSLSRNSHKDGIHQR
jgi:DNA-binding NarL/FixJ family response regulator